MNSESQYKQEAVVFLCLGYALQKGEDNKVYMHKELEERLDFLAGEYKKHQSQYEGIKGATIITSGRGKVDIESEYMRDYLIKKHGISAFIILSEKYSMNTVENFLFAFFSLWTRFGNRPCLSNDNKNKIKFEVRVFTSDFHVKRVQYIADAATKAILPVFNNCVFTPLQFLGAKTSSDKTEEAAILWEKATEKINRIFSFNFDINKFMEEREFTKDDKENFIVFKNKILQNQNLQIN